MADEIYYMYKAEKFCENTIRPVLVHLRLRNLNALKESFVLCVFVRPSAIATNIYRTYKAENCFEGILKPLLVHLRFTMLNL